MKRRNFLTATLATGAFSAFEIENKPTKKGFIVKNGDARFGIHTPFKGINPNDVKISSKDTGGQLSVFEYIGHEKTGPSLHIHFYQDEIFYVAEGEYVFQLDKERFTLKKGDTIFLPRNVPHTWIQTSDFGKLIYFLQPAGKMEEFFSAMSKLQGPPSKEYSDKMHKMCGMKTIGPPMVL
jgi:quercetin dioxygenase-like cupin family protein